MSYFGPAANAATATAAVLNSNLTYRKNDHAFQAKRRSTSSLVASSTPPSTPAPLILNLASPQFAYTPVTSPSASAPVSQSLLEEVKKLRETVQVS